MIKKLFKWVMCIFTTGHSFKFVRNIYGDEIIYCGWNRSEWQSYLCGHYKFEKELQDDVVQK